MVPSGTLVIANTGKGALFLARLHCSVRVYLVCAEQASHANVSCWSDICVNSQWCIFCRSRWKHNHQSNPKDSGSAQTCPYTENIIAERKAIFKSRDVERASGLN